MQCNWVSFDNNPRRNERCPECGGEIKSYFDEFGNYNHDDDDDDDDG